MKARLPRIDYSDIRPDWAPMREFAHRVNASSTIPSFVEPWLIKVMRRAKEILPPEEVQLHKEVDIFIAQEAQHYRQHNGFNKRIRQHYPEIIPHEQKIERDYDEMLNNRPLKFCLAYAEGFESMGPIAARLWFEDYAPYLQGADYEAVALWKWHMAEEYEHREVCFRLFKALYARTPATRVWNGWLYRCYGFFSAIRHLGGYGKAVYREMISADRRAMTPDELSDSRQKEKQFGTFMSRHTMRDIVSVFSPFYNPRDRREPVGLSAYLQRFERGGDMGRVQPLTDAPAT